MTSTTAAALACLLATTLTAPSPSTDRDGAHGSWPVPQPGVVSGFRPPTEDWQPGHRGADLRAAPGDPVRAVLAGRIGYAGTVAGKPVVTLVLADGRRLTFEPVRALVRAGVAVRQGEVIGVVSAEGGHCGGRRCLHLGLLGAYGYEDPLDLLRRPRAVLKPLDRRRVSAPRRSQRSSLPAARGWASR